MHASYAMYIYIYIWYVCVNGDILHNKVHDLQLTTNIFMTNPCEKTGPAFTPATNPPAFSNLVGSTEPPKVTLSEDKAEGSAGGLVSQPNCGNMPGKSSPCRSSLPTRRGLKSLLLRCFFSTCPRKTPIKATRCNKQRLLFLHMMLSGTLSSQATDHYIIATQHAQSAWQGHAFQTLVRFVSKCQFLQTVRQCHPFQIHTLAEPISKCQILQTARQAHSFQTLVEGITKNQILQTVWPSHMF